jgi:hypothetical protein
MRRFFSQLVKICGQRYARNFADLVVAEIKRDIRMYADSASFILLSCSVCAN